MQILSSTKSPSFLLKQAKYLLILVSGVLIVANFYFLTATTQHAHSYREQQNQATWFLLQLTKEFTELNVIVPFAGNNDENLEHARLKYELTWSRFDILLNNNEADSFLSRPGAKEFFQKTFIDFQSLDIDFQNLHTPSQARALSKKVSRLYQSIIKYANTNFRVKSAFYEHQKQAANRLNQIQLASMMLLIVCVVLVSFIFNKESEYHKQQSLTDSMTGIANRLALFNDIKWKIANKLPFEIFLLDLNGFKQINDQYGHHAGDQVLKTFAYRLRQLKANCYRIGGDEFAVISDKIDNHKFCSIIQDIHQQMKASITTEDGTVIHVGTSIGQASFPREATEIRDLMQIADNKMYADKRSIKK